MLPAHRYNFAELPTPQVCSRRSFLLTPFPVCPVIGLSCPRNKIPPPAKTAAKLIRGWTEILFAGECIAACFFFYLVCLSFCCATGQQQVVLHKETHFVYCNAGQRERERERERETALVSPPPSRPRPGSCHASSAEICCRIGVMTVVTEKGTVSSLSSNFANFVSFFHPFCTFISVPQQLKLYITLTVVIDRRSMSWFFPNLAKFVYFLYPFCTFISFSPQLKQFKSNLFRWQFWKYSYNLYK